MQGRGGLWRELGAEGARKQPIDTWTASRVRQAGRQAGWQADWEQPTFRNTTSPGTSEKGEGG